jgi:mannose/fructose/N-acetylgalactosamine-specific phosphotransferase system component IIC
MRKKIVSLNIGTIAALIAVSCIVYYLLLRDTFLHTSISSIITQSHHLEVRKRLIVHALLPIYIAMMIFGAALLGSYIGSSFQQFLVRTIKNKELPY